MTKSSLVLFSYEYCFFKEMIKNKFSIYVIENSLELLIKINENYYETTRIVLDFKNMINKLKK